GRQALLDFQDVPAGLCLDRANDRTGRRIEDGRVEIGEQLAACDFAEIAAFVFRAGFGDGTRGLREISAAFEARHRCVGFLPYCALSRTMASLISASETVMPRRSARSLMRSSLMRSSTRPLRRSCFRVAI